jgi:hypothetical protein
MRPSIAFAAVLAAAGSLCGQPAHPPAWWASRGAVFGLADDYAAANLGQLKHMATAAAAELDAALPGGAGPELAALIAGWSQAYSPEAGRDDFAAVNLGQLKAVAKLFYDRLHAVGYSGPPLAPTAKYPWSGPMDDYALANLGQLKLVFSFAPEPGDGDGGAEPDWNTDSDFDGLPDWWEIEFGSDPSFPDAGAFPPGSSFTFAHLYAASLGSGDPSNNPAGLVVHSP